MRVGLAGGMGGEMAVSRWVRRCCARGRGGVGRWFVGCGVCIGIDSDNFDVGLGVLGYCECVDASVHG